MPDIIPSIEQVAETIRETGGFTVIRKWTYPDCRNPGQMTSEYFALVMTDPEITLHPENHPNFQRLLKCETWTGQPEGNGFNAEYRLEGQDLRVLGRSHTGPPDWVDTDNVVCSYYEHSILA